MPSVSVIIPTYNRHVLVREAAVPWFIWASVIGNTIYIPGGATAQGFGATTSHESFTVR